MNKLLVAWMIMLLGLGSSQAWATLTLSATPNPATTGASVSASGCATIASTLKLSWSGTACATGNSGDVTGRLCDGITNNPLNRSVSMTGAGSCTFLIHSVTCCGGADKSVTVTVNKGDQTITVGTAAPASAAYNSSFSVAATASSGLGVSIAGSGGCSGSGTSSATLTMTSPTTACTVTYSQAGDSNYNAATNVTSSTTASKASQTITVTTAAPASAAYNSSFSVAATASSGLGVNIAGSGGCSGSGTSSATLTMTSGTTACTVTYSQAGDSNYNAATNATSSTTASKASQTITVTTPAPASATYNSSFSVAATASSGLGVNIAGSGGCSGSGTSSATLTMTSGTTACTVTYSQAGNTNYSAATNATSSTTASKASQSITVTTAAPASAAYNSSFSVAATASSGLAVSIVGSGGCSGSGTSSATLTMNSGTACTVTYSQAGDTNYAAATNATSTTSVGVDHIEIAHDGAAVGGVAETITLKACVNSGTGACVQYGGSQAITLNTSSGTFAASGTGSVTIAAFTGSTTQSLTIPMGGSATLSVSSPTPATSAAYTCNNGSTIAASPSGNCTLGALADHYQISTADSSAVAADGSTSKTITIRACSNALGSACSVLSSDTSTVSLSNLGVGTLSSSAVTLVAGEKTLTITSTSTGNAQLKVTAPSANNGYTCTQAGSTGTQTAGSDTEAKCQVSFSAPALHHFQISQANTATVAADGTTTKALTVKACGDLGTTCNALATGTTSLTLASSLAGTGADVSIAPLTLTSGQATINISSTTAGTTTFSTSTGSYRCSTDGGSTTVASGAVAECQMSFTVAPLHHYLISQADSNAVAAVSGSKTITVKACADTGTTCNALATGATSVVVTSSLAGTTGNLLGLGPGTTVNFTNGVGSFSMSGSTAGTTTLATSSGSYRCSTDGGSSSVAGGAVAECRVNITASLITRYLISQADTAMISDDGFTSKTITIKACTDAGATCNSQPAGSSTVTVLSSLSGTSTTPSTSPLTLTNGVATFQLTSSQSGFSYLSIDSPPAGGYLCSTDGGATLTTGGSSVTACRVGILVAGNGFKGTGIYSAIKTNWRRLGWSNCSWSPLACAQTYSPSMFWVSKGSIQTTHAIGYTSNPNKLWVVENAAYAGAYTVRDYYEDKCLALGNGTESPISLGYLVYKTCDAADKAQQWLIYSSTAGSATGGVELKTIPTVGYLSSSLCWTNPVWTIPETELYVRDAGPSCGDWKDVFYFGGVTTASPLYVKLTHSPTASVCDSGSTVTVQACGDAACTTGYGSAQTITLTATGSATWPSGNSVTIPANSTAGVSLTLKDTTAEDVYIYVSSPNNVLDSCSNGAGGTDCKLTFQNGGLSLSVSNFYAHKGIANATVTARKYDGVSGCAPLLQGAQSITFWGRYQTPTTGTKALSVNGSSVTMVSAAAAAPAGTAVTLNFNASGVATFPLNYDDAGSVTLTASAEQTSPALSASESITTAPAGFCITPTIATGCPSGDSQSASCLKYVAAGDPFGMTVQAVAWQSDADTDYCSGNTSTPNFATDTTLGTPAPTVSLATTLVAPSTGSNTRYDGVSSLLATSNFEIAGGQWVSASQAIAEVGIFTVKASSSQGGLAIPQTSTAHQGAENLGRFYPKRIFASSNAPTLLNGDINGWSCTFTYADQAMRFSSQPQIKVTGLNANGEVTRNYRLGDFWKLDNALPVEYLNDPGFSTPGATLTPATSTSATGTDDGDGRTFNLTDTLKYAHDGEVTSSDAPFDVHIALTLTATSLKDSDGACYLNTSSNCSAGGDDFTEALSGASIRLGQVVAKNVVSAATSNIDVPVDIMYWTGSAWSPNTLDNGCTSFGALDGNYQGELQAGDISLSLPEVVPGGTVGQWQVPLSAPTGSHAGSVDITITGLPAYLKRSPAGSAPMATATFSHSASMSNGQSKHVMFRGEVTGR